MSLAKKLAKDSFIYGLGGLFTNGITFLLLPIYTRIFSPSEYGTIEMLLIISNFVSYFLIFGMDSAQSFFFFKYKDKGKVVQGEIISAILQWRIIVGIFIIIIGTLVSPIINNLFFDGNLSLIYFLIAFVGTLFNQIMVQSIDIMRLSFRPWSFLIISSLKSLLSGGFILLFIFIFKLNILGYFLGSTCSTIIVGFLGWAQIKELWQFNKFQYKYFPSILKFSIPLFLSGIFEYFMISSDRWFIQYFNGQSQLGLFAIGAKFSLLVALVIQIFSKAWWPIALDIMNNKDAKYTIRKISRIYTGISSILIISLSFLSPYIIKFFAGPKFYNAWPIIGILSWQAIFNGFANFIACIGLYKSEKTKLFLPIIFFISFIAILSNFIMVPLLGSIGAALATSFTYLFYMLVIMQVSSNYWNVGYNLKLLSFHIFLGIIGTMLLTLFRSQFSEGFLIVLVISLIMIISLSSIKKEELKKGYELLRNFI